METKSRCAQLLAPLAAIAALWTTPGSAWAGEIYVTNTRDSVNAPNLSVGQHTTTRAAIDASLVTGG